MNGRNARCFGPAASSIVHQFFEDRNCSNDQAFPGHNPISRARQTPSDPIRKLAWIIEERGYAEQDFPDLDWNRIANELPLVSA